MTIHRILLALVAGAMLPLAGCQLDSTASTGTATQGTVDFSLPAALRAQVRNDADSLRIELRQGAKYHSASCALDSTVHVDDLESGRWMIDVGLYSTDGVLHYFGSSSVDVTPGKRSHADVTLRPAKGEVDISIHLEDNQGSDTLRPRELWGTWYFNNWKGPSPKPTGLSFTLDSSGGLVGWNGKDSFDGSWGIVDSELVIRRNRSPLDTFNTWGVGDPIPNSSPYSWIYYPAEQILSLYSLVDTFAIKVSRQPLSLPPDPSDLLGNWLMLQVDSATGKPPVHATLAFHDSDIVVGNDGCNDFSGIWFAQQGKLSFRILKSTRRNCGGIPGANGLQTQLKQTTNWLLDEHFLYLRDDAGFNHGTFGRL